MEATEAALDTTLEAGMADTEAGIVPADMADTDTVRTVRTARTVRRMDCTANKTDTADDPARI